MKNTSREIKGNIKTNLIGSAVLMAVITLAAKVLGLLRDILVANAYGMNSAAKAYEAASSLPTTVFDLVIGGVVSAAFIPVFNSILVKKGKKDAMGFANLYVNFIIMICIVISALGIIFAPFLVRLIAPGLDSETSTLASGLTRIIFPMILFTGIAYSFVGILQSMGEYTLPALISLFSNLIMVGYLFLLNSTFGIVGLAVAMLLGWASQAFVQIPKVHSLGFRYRPTFKVFDKEVIRAARNALPILIASWTIPLCNLINKSFASRLNEGRALTALGYANRLYTIIVGLFSFVATNLLFPYFSKAEAEGDKEGARRLIRSSVKTLVYIIAPIAVGIICLSRPFTALMYQRGEFTEADTLLTATALSRYAIGMIFMAANEVMTKAIFSVEKPKYAMISSICAMVFNILLVSIGSSFLDLGGIALVSGIATILNLVLNMIFAHRIGVVSFQAQDYFDIIKSVASALVMIPVIIFLTGNFESDILSLVISVAACVPIYFICTLLLRSEESKFITGSIIGKIRK